jgi:DNA-binding transcriptional regulator YhcF (GntR family)
MDNEITKEIIDWSLDESLPKQIMEYFKPKIKSGCITPGTVLPSLQDLSGKLEIDINYVRDAMELLREEHLVRTTNGIGTIVLAENEWKSMAILLPDTASWHWQKIYKEIDYFMNANHWKVKSFTHE